VALVALTAIAAVVIATRGGLAMHHDAIDLLHLMGAEDQYIADQFAGQALRLGLRGGVLGLLLAAATLSMLALGGRAIDPRLLPQLWPEGAESAVLLLVPVTTAFLGWLTARATVLRALKRMV
jgi:cell division transport system permease protein